VNLFGFGTQRLERELERLFPELRAGDTLLRLDADTMRTAADYAHALGSFRDGHARALLGTQMIAKGLDFPGVELIGVINADTALALPDFRAAERSFQLVCQVAGRAGRGPECGRVARAIIQTLNPQEPAILCAARHDFPGFAAGELSLRREAGLPPFGRMARIVCRDEDAAKAESRAGEIASALREALARENAEAGCLIKGPMPCPIARLAGHHRFAVELLAPGAAQIQRVLTTLRSAGLVRSDAHTAVDVDPLSLQ
jgi:primosomal protein N' (replication factor Y)